MSRRATTPANCPVCGAAVPAGAKACPECGADERSGWNEDATRYDGLELPDEAFDAGDALREADWETQSRSTRASLLWRAVGFVLLVVVIMLYIGL